MCCHRSSFKGALVAQSHMKRVWWDYSLSQNPTLECMSQSNSQTVMWTCTKTLSIVLFGRVESRKQPEGLSDWGVRGVKWGVRGGIEELNVVCLSWNTMRHLEEMVHMTSCINLRNIASSAELSKNKMRPIEWYLSNFSRINTYFQGYISSIFK